MGELARQPDAPFLPETPLELLTPRPGEGYSWKDKNLVPIACATAGAISWVAYNIGARRPFYAGIKIIYFHA